MADMVTRRRLGRTRPVPKREPQPQDATETAGPFLKENRKAKGVSAAEMGKRLGIERESVYRFEKNPIRHGNAKLERYARALGITLDDLWTLPGGAPRPSIDALVADKPADVQALAFDLVRRIVEGKQP